MNWFQRKNKVQYVVFFNVCVKIIMFYTINFTAFSSETGATRKSYSFNSGAAVATSDTQTDGAKRTASMDPELLDVMARVPPSEMEGINGLWKIAIDVQEKRVGESVTKLLLQLHSDLDYEIQDQLTTFENLFIESCFRIIQ